MTTERRMHWEHVYETKPTDRLGWFKPHLDTPLEWIRSLRLLPDSPVIDIGGGASTLVDDLLEAGFGNITVLDIAESALAHARDRLGEQGRSVNWIVADITESELPPATFALWHDRAVFHFLTDPDDRARYRQQLASALLAGSSLIIGTFAPAAPPTCSGLPVQRYALDDLVAEIGHDFELEKHREEMHITPGGVRQAYLYCMFRKRE